MSYATLLDALFALDLTDSELRDSTSMRPMREATRDTGGTEYPTPHPEPEDRPKLFEEQSKLRRAAQPKAAMRRAKVPAR